ncbi:hypothetical protein ACSAGD_07315 [Paramicrobacterium sp. CJ85]|uniref:hypothetical protein n=1 Tax=Paramicrobacterium sp. CJ85 TaxID=3445355 RepID=UPI003F5EB2B4
MTPVIEADAASAQPENPTDASADSSTESPVGENQEDEAQAPTAPKAAKPTPSAKDLPADQAQETDHIDSSEQISDAFRPKSGKEDDESSRSEPARAFDTLIAPEARGSDVLTTSSVLLLPGASGHTSDTKSSTTGEIVVTGSLDLPHADAKAERSSSDRPDVDSGADNSGEGTATAGTPVSATRAVSTHAVTRDVITPPTKTSSPKLLMILAITAGVLCVAVIGVVIVGLLTNSF